MKMPKQLIYQKSIALIYYQNKLGSILSISLYIKTTLHSYTINQLKYENNIALIYYQRKFEVFYESTNI